MYELTKLIREDMCPALGVTEPGAIAFAVALAREHTEGTVQSVRVALNSGMYKNAFTCGIPNSSEYGNLYAAALGAVAADAKKGLESLDGITAEDNERAQQMVSAGQIEVVLDHISSEITIEAKVCTESDCCIVYISGGHTDVKRIEKNGENIFRKEAGTQLDKTVGEQPEKAVIHTYTLAQILEYVQDVSIQEILFIRDAFSMNMELLEEGLLSDRTTFGPMLLKQNDNRTISKDALRTAQLLCNGAIEARVLGLSRPAMSITGSGAHGIIATMPLFAWYKTHNDTVAEEELIRAAALSYLITMYIKEYSGKLSAFCGCGIAAGTGMACGLAYMRRANITQMDMVIRNMASGLTGMICDGGNQGCTMKGIVAVDAAFRAVDLALQGIAISGIHGINGRTSEETMRNMGRIASPGMEKTEEIIVQIMQEKGK